ncbi:MAG: group II intron maturase-specific domain-containing protein, partial [Thermoplasmata archaeon]
AREILIPILRGWGNYFAYGTVSSKVRSIFYYAEASLMRMYCNQHHIPARWEYSDIKLRHLSVSEYMPETLMANGYKSYRESSR